MIFSRLIPIVFLASFEVTWAFAACAQDDEPYLANTNRRGGDYYHFSLAGPFLTSANIHASMIPAVVPGHTIPPGPEGRNVGLKVLYLN
jgi:hypothetical protein